MINKMCDFKAGNLIDAHLACAEFIDVKDPGRLALADLLKTVLLSVEVSGAMVFILRYLSELAKFFKFLNQIVLLLPSAG